MRALLLAFFLFAFIHLFSQSDEDALRYTRYENNGTARSIAMCGALGALGTDLSCLNNNPAGLGFYKKSDVAISFGMRLANQKSNYNDSLTKDFRNNFVVPNMGIAGAGVNKEIDKKNFYRANFGFSINRMANFKNNITVAGPSKGSSMAIAFAAAAQGKLPDNLDQYYEYWPYFYDLIDTVNGNNTQYESSIPQGANMKQEYLAIEGGGNTEFAFGGGYSFNDKFYAGWSLGFPIINFTRSSVYKESATDSNYQTPNLPYKIASFSHSEELKTTGKGINLKIGFIYRFSQYFRAGIALHTPSAIRLKDTYSSTFDIEYFNYTTFTDTSQQGLYKYSLITPGKLQAGFSILLQKVASINVDIESVNYATMNLKSSTDYFNQVNKFIRTNYSRGLNLKLGFERNIKPVILRCGYAMYGGPTAKLFTGTGVRHSFALGAGLRKDKYFFDFSYSLTLKKENFYLYNPLYAKASIMRYGQSFLLITLGSKI